MSWLLMLFGCGYYFIFGCLVLGTIVIHFMGLDTTTWMRRRARYVNRIARKQWMAGLDEEDRLEYLARDRKVSYVMWVLRTANKIHWHFIWVFLGEEASKAFWWISRAERYRDFFENEMKGRDCVKNGYNDCELEAIGPWTYYVKDLDYGISEEPPNVYGSAIAAWRCPKNWKERSSVSRTKSPFFQELEKYGALELYQTDPIAALEQVKENKAWHARREEEREFARAKDHLRDKIREWDAKVARDGHI